MACTYDNAVCRFLTVFLCLCLVVYIATPTLKRRSLGPQGLCPCSCDCFQDFAFSSFPLGCGENDPDTNEEMEKSSVTLISEELSLWQIVDRETLERKKALTADAKRVSSLYRKEAEKCAAGVETCETAREIAQQQLATELKLSDLWERRALQLEWKEVK